MTPKTITPQEVNRLISEGALLVDIREADEHAREKIPGATNMPVARVDQLSCGGRPVIFRCRSGMRTKASAILLTKAAGNAPCYVMAGGIDAWRAEGLPTRLDRSQPIEVMRQVQLAAGSLVLLGAVLSLLVAPAFALLSGFVGAGLMLAGATGWCGMAQLLQRMPWNRQKMSR